MKRKEMENGVHCVEFGFKDFSNGHMKARNKQFDNAYRYKCDCVDFMEEQLQKIKNENKDFDEAYKRIVFLNSKEGKVVKKSERSDELKKSYKVVGEIIKGTNFLSPYTQYKEFNKIADKEYNLYLPDDCKMYLVSDIVQSYEKFFFYNGKSVHKPRYDDILSLRSKPPVSANGNKNSTSATIIFEGDKIFYRIWDVRDCVINPIKNGKRKSHKYYEYELYCNKSDMLQSQILNNIYIGATKLVRYWKKGKWRYRVQVNFEKISPIVQEINTRKGKIAIDCGTETSAIVRDDGYQEIIELTPNTPRITERIKELDRYMDNSRRATNPLAYHSNGIPKSKKELKKDGIEVQYSKRYKKARAERRELYRILREQRRLNNNKDAKHVTELGNEFVIENNSFKAWGQKLCRLSDKAKKIYDNGIRKNDYTKQQHDRASGYMASRIESIAKQKGMSYQKISGGFNCSTYNHFTKQNDIFTSLSNRLIVFDDTDISEKFKNVTYKFDKTITTIYDENGVGYILQRDLYAASKMLFLIPHKEKNEDGKEITVWEFDQSGYEKFFKETFYPKHKEYIEKLIEKRGLDVPMSGTILGF